MKTFTIRKSVLSIAFSLICLVISTGSKAGTLEGSKKDLVSELHLEPPSLLGPKGYSVDGKDLKNNPLRRFLIPLNEGINAFIDCDQSLHPDALTLKDPRTNYRAFIGFHFSLR